MHVPRDESAGQRRRQEARSRARSGVLEQLEDRRLFAAVWSDYAQLIGQDDAASTYASLTGKGQTIALIDTGIDYNNASLGGGFGSGKKVIGGYDFYANDSDPMDTDGHGTETAGMVAANPFTQNGKTYQGIAPGASLVALRVGTGDDISDDNIEKALQWVITNYKKYSIDVVNISLGSGNYATATTARSQLADEFATIKGLGIFVVAASGNSGDTSSGGVSYPAADPNVFAVGSITSADQISDFTQRGRTLDLLAPGEQVVTTKLGGGYSTVDGTSFSSPIVAGVVAVLKQAASSLGVDDLASVLRTSSKSQYDGDGDGGRTTGEVYARLDLVNAIMLAQARDVDTGMTYINSSKYSAFDTAYDASGILHIAYYDAAHARLLYTTQNSDGTFATPTIVDRSRDNIGSQLSLAIDQTGKPAIAYYDATAGDLKYAFFTGSKWSNQVIESNKVTGQTPSLVFNDAGDPRIAYYFKNGGDLKLASYNRSTSSWTRETLDSTGDVGVGASLAFNNDAGVYTLAVAYADKTNGDLKYWRYNSADTTNVNGIYTAVIDNLSGVANIDLKLISTTAGGAARVAYQDTKSQTVKVAYRNDSWFSSVISNTGSSGQNVQSYVDDAGAYHVVYYSAKKAGTYDAVVGSSNAVASITRIGTVGLIASVSTDANGNTTIVGLNRTGKSIGATDIV